MSIRLEREVARLERENAELRDELASETRWAHEYWDGFQKALAKLRAALRREAGAEVKPKLDDYCKGNCTHSNRDSRRKCRRKGGCWDLHEWKKVRK